MVLKCQLAHLRSGVSALYPSQVTGFGLLREEYDLGQGHLPAAKVLFQGLTLETIF